MGFWSGLAGVAGAVQKVANLLAGSKFIHDVNTNVRMVVTGVQRYQALYVAKGAEVMSDAKWTLVCHGPPPLQCSEQIWPEDNFPINFPIPPETQVRQPQCNCCSSCKRIVNPNVPSVVVLAIVYLKALKALVQGPSNLSFDVFPWDTPTGQLQATQNEILGYKPLYEEPEEQLDGMHTRFYGYKNEQMFDGGFFDSKFPGNKLTNIKNGDGIFLVGIGGDFYIDPAEDSQTITRVKCYVTGSFSWNTSDSAGKGEGGMEALVVVPEAMNV